MAAATNARFGDLESTSVKPFNTVPARHTYLASLETAALTHLVRRS